MIPAAADWFARRTSTASDWSFDDVLALKGDESIAVVIPARNEESTIAGVVGAIRSDLVDTGLVDELLVMDSLSVDRTGHVADRAGATVHSVASVRPDLGVRPGKGEALWKSTFVTTSSILVFIDADLTNWGTHFVTGLLGPMLATSRVQLVRGFYDRILDSGSGSSYEGGRVTELVARPWLAVNRPALAGVVQPLAGEWAIRRRAFESMHVPVGYGVELATLLDVHDGFGLDAIAQVDLGSRGHRHQTLHDLGAMAMELLVVGERRLSRRVPGRRDTTGSDEVVTLDLLGRDRVWATRTVSVVERPPVTQVRTGRPMRSAVLDVGGG